MNRQSVRQFHLSFISQSCRRSVKLFVNFLSVLYSLVLSLSLSLSLVLPFWVQNGCQKQLWAQTTFQINCDTTTTTTTTLTNKWYNLRQEACFASTLVFCAPHPSGQHYPELAIKRSLACFAWLVSLTHSTPGHARRGYLFQTNFTLYKLFLLLLLIFSSTSWLPKQAEARSSTISRLLWLVFPKQVDRRCVV